MDFKTFIGQAWDDHVNAAQAVAERLDEGIALIGDEEQLNDLMNLGRHVHGEHLGTWQQGIAFIERLSALPSFDLEGASGQSYRRCVASLRFSGLPTTDPMHRTLAAMGNNLASNLEQKTERSADERALMILAAQTARHHWAIAGTWLETERAEYRLANTWLQAGDLARAREHAQACLEIVAANNAPALERLFGWEALGLVERAAGNATGHAQALARAREAFAELDESDKSWCAASVDKLAA